MRGFFNALEKFPKASLMTGPTPLDRLDRLSDYLGIDLWIKRDDLTGLGFGGNKIRQLDYYFGAAMQQSADTVLITGAVQSNYVRCAAAAAARLGMHSVVQLEDRVPDMDDTYANSGNVLLDRLLGARIIRYPRGEDEVGADRALRSEAARLRGQGRVPYVIPLGLDNPPLGALGYADAAVEIVDAGHAFDAVVLASGSGQTHAGMLAGLRALGIKTPVYGICVRRDAATQAERLGTVLGNLYQMLGCDAVTDGSDILTWDGVLQLGYGKPGPESVAALQMMARHEGLFLDPVYTAKSFAGVVGLVGEGVIAAGSKVLFLHTGGLPALFAYPDAL